MIALFVAMMAAAIVLFVFAMRAGKKGPFSRQLAFALPGIALFIAGALLAANISGGWKRDPLMASLLAADTTQKTPASQATSALAFETDRDTAFPLKGPCAVIKIDANNRASLIESEWDEKRPAREALGTIVVVKTLTLTSQGYTAGGSATGAVHTGVQYAACIFYYDVAGARYVDYDQVDGERLPTAYPGSAPKNLPDDDAILETIHARLDR